MRAHADFGFEVYQRYERRAGIPGNAILEDAIAEVADAVGVLVLVRGPCVARQAF